MRKALLLFLLTLMVCTSLLVPAMAQNFKPDTIKVEFTLGSSEIQKSFLPVLAKARKKIEFGWTAEIYADADQTGWNATDNRSKSLDGGLMVTRAQSVARSLGLKTFNVQALTNHDQRVVLIILTPPKEITIEALENAKKYKWYLWAGSQVFTCGHKRNLFAPMSAGVGLTAGKSFFEVQGGLNPWSSEGYQHYWYRDIMGTGMVGYQFYTGKTISVLTHVGAMIGWEFTSETNEFDMQALGGLAGVGVVGYMNNNLSVVLKASYIHAEISDFSKDSGNMYNGFTGSLGIKIEF